MIGEALLARVELRVKLMLGRFGDEVERVSVRFSQTLGREGDPEKLCEITVDLKPTKLSVEYADPSLSVAMERAGDRAVRSVARALEQRGWSKTRR